MYKFILIYFLAFAKLSAAIEYDIVDLGFTDIYRSDGGYPEYVQINAKGSVIGENITFETSPVRRALEDEVRRGFLASPEQGLIPFHPHLLTALNDHDQVIGNTDNRAIMFIRGIKKNLGWLWHPEKGHFYLHSDPLLADRLKEIYADDINNSGQLVGHGYSAWVAFPQEAPTLFVYDFDEGVKFLDISNARPPFSINDKGQVMGRREGGTFIWDPDSGLIDLPGCLGFSLNNQGQIAGDISDDEEEDGEAFLYTPGTGVKPLSSSSKKSRYVVALNDKGEVIGQLQNNHAFFWSEKSGMVDLGTLTGKKSKPNALNNQSQVVGYTSSPKKSDDKSRKAFIWTPKMGMKDLTQLIPLNQGWSQLVEATSINDKGEIVGIGIRIGGSPHIFKLIPR